MTSRSDRPVALVTGASRPAGIGAALARGLAADGWDVGITHWQPYDARMPWGSGDTDVDEVVAATRRAGARVVAVPADLSDVESPGAVFDAVETGLGPVRALVLAHCESVDSDLRTTTVESFDRHLAVNVRATWLLVRELAHRLRGPYGSGRIVSLTSDHVAGNLPYGASKGAMDRVVLAAARELADLGVTANVVNPGPNDTGWMNEQTRIAVRDATRWVAWADRATPPTW